MEDVLAVYNPVILPIREFTLDKKPVQLFAHIRKSRRSKTGTPDREVSEYLCNGTRSIFLFTDSLAGWRYVDAMEHRLKKDWANRIEHLLEGGCPDTEKVVLVTDNLNTHTVFSLSEAFNSEIAFRLASHLEIPFTPKHGPLAEHGSNRIIGLEQTLHHYPETAKSGNSMLGNPMREQKQSPGRS